MALFKIFKGENTESLFDKRPTATEGYCYFTTSERKMFIDIASGDLTQDGGGRRVCLNAEYADMATQLVYPDGSPISAGDSSIPVYFNGAGQPMACGNVLGVGVTGGLFDITGQAITSFTKPEDEGKKPVYFRDGYPIQCDDILDVSILGNAVTATNADFAEHAVYADSSTIADGTYFLLDLSNPQVSLNAGNQKLPVYFNDGVPTECDKFLPLSAGEEFKLTGSLGLTEGQNYGEDFPPEEDRFLGQLFFIEDDAKYHYLPEGGIQNQILIKNSDKDGDASWGDLVTLPKGGTEGQIIVKNSNEDGDASWQNFPELNYLSLNGGTVSGDITANKFIGSLEGNATSATNATNIYSSVSTSKAYILGTTTASNGNHATVYNESVYTSGSVLYGAAWNDYAEYRDQNEAIEPGYCVASADNGQVYKTTEKFQACDGIVSDTFGFAIGETDKCKTPLAVAGRVLAYCESSREQYHAGDTVCAGPNGKVCKMTREEIREWPDRIIGIVSEIPEYEYWGSGNVPVNGRIWIKVK